MAGLFSKAFGSKKRKKKGIEIGRGLKRVDDAVYKDIHGIKSSRVNPKSKRNKQLEKQLKEALGQA